MSNMSYCRFENTSRDLADCVYAMRDAHDVTELDLNDYEADATHRMKLLCEKYLEEYKRLEFAAPPSEFDFDL